MSYPWGETLRVSIFGQSHAASVGVTVEGLPSGEPVDLPELERFLQRRAPGRSPLSTARYEPDKPQILCGLTGGVTSGSPLTAIIENTDVRPRDYEPLKDIPRPGHADYPACVKYGGSADLSGGGAFSGRMTAPMCIAGGICLQMLRRRGVTVTAHILSVGDVEDEPFDPLGLTEETADRLHKAQLPTLSAKAGEKMRKLILAAAEEGDSVGGVVECLVTGLPVGLGGPLFDGLDGKLASALFGIPAVKGVDFGAGFGAARLRGSENNDAYTVKDGSIVTETNHAGGVLGGISTGMPLVFRTAFKPTPSIAKPQKSVKLSSLEETELVVGGRHDPCVVPRAVPVVEAVAALTLMDALLTEEKQVSGGQRDLAGLRGEIDRLDGEIVPLLSRRMRCSDEIGLRKAEIGLPVRDEGREEALLRRVSALAGDECAESVTEVYRAVLAASRARQSGGKERA